MLDNLVAHLVENAVVYNDSDSPRVEVGVTATEDTVAISVSDNGPGLPERQLDLLARGEIGSYEDRSTGSGWTSLAARPELRWADGGHRHG